MPTMANLVIKKHDGTTDVTYGSKQSGGSPTQPAVWTNSNIGTAAAHRPEVRFHVKSQNGSKATVVLTAQYPSLSTDSTTGITSVIGRQKAKIEYQLDTSCPQTDINEFTAQIGNALASTLIRDGVRNVSGFGA